MKKLTIKELHELNFYEFRDVWEDLLYNRNKTEEEEKYFSKVDKVKEARSGINVNKRYRKIN